MELSKSLHKGITDVKVGKILNTFKIRKRRDTFFFEEIVADYIKACEDTGHEKEMHQIGYEWFSAIFSELFQPELKDVSPEDVINKIMNIVWANLGALESSHLDVDGDKLILIHKGESVTRIIGKNNLFYGLAEGVLTVLFNSKLQPISNSYSNGSTTYTFKVLHKPVKIKRKSFDEYIKRNVVPDLAGFNLKSALEKGIMKLDGNRVLFRGKRLWYVENTLFHLFGEKALMLDEAAEISHRFFSDILKDSSPDEKLVLLKNLLQMTGWGAVNIQSNNRSTTFSITCPPHGFQSGDDNWGFLANVILGYLRNINKSYTLSSSKFSGKTLTFVYST